MKPMVVGLAVCVVGFLLFEYFQASHPANTPTVTSPQPGERAADGATPIVSNTPAALPDSQQMLLSVIKNLWPYSGERLPEAKEMLMKHKDDLALSGVIMKWMLEGDPELAIQCIVETYDHVTPSMAEKFREYARDFPAKAWSLISTRKDWRERVLLTGMFRPLVENASKTQVEEFLNTCDNGTFSIFFPHTLTKLAGDGFLQQLTIADQYLEQAKSRGLNVGQAILYTYPDLFTKMRSEGTHRLVEASTYLDRSPLRSNPEAMSAFAESYVKADPIAAFEWIGKLPGESRAKAVETAAEILAKTDLNAAVDLAFNQNLALEDQKTVMFQLHFAISGPDGNYEVFHKTAEWLKQNNMDTTAMDERFGSLRPPR